MGQGSEGLPVEGTAEDSTPPPEGTTSPEDILPPGSVEEINPEPSGASEGQNGLGIEGGGEMAPQARGFSPLEEELKFVTFLYPDGSDGFAQYGEKLLIKDGFVTEPDNSDLPIPEGYVSFDGWFTAPQDDASAGRFDFSEGGLEDNRTLYAHYNKEWLVQFLDGDGNVYHSVPVENGSTVSLPGSEPEFPLPSEYFFENKWERNGAEYDFTTPVTSDLVLSPVLIPGAYVIFVSYGTPVTPIFVKQGSTVGDIKKWPENPSRNSYDFNYWTTTNGGTGGTAVASDTVIGADNLVLYGNWTGKPANYKIVYWVEKPGMFAANESPKLGDPAHYDYGYEESKTETAGETVTVNSIPAYGTFPVTNGNANPMRFAQFQPNQNATAVISGNGDTIINVYCTLKVYTITFNLGTFTTGSGRGQTTHYRTMTIGDTTYGGNQTAGNYTLPVKFGQDVSKIWPSSATATFSYAPTSGSPTANTYAYQGWTWETSINRTGSRVSRVNTIAVEHLPLDANTTSFELSRYGTANNNGNDLRYYVELLVGQSPEGLTPRTYNDKIYVLMPDYSQDNVANVLSGKGIHGLTYVDNEPTNKTYYFYYSRIRSTLYYDMNGPGTQIASVPNIMYEQPLADRFVKVADVDGYRFLGWYKDANGTQLFDFKTETMPANNLTVYAKWEPTALTVTFLDADGRPLGENNTQGVEKGGSIKFNNLTIDGLVYDSNLSVPGKGVFDGWDFIPYASAAKTKFHSDLLIWADTNLYARWKTEGFKITYEAENGPADGASYRFGTDARVLDKGSYSPPEGQVFIGWKVKDSTPGYYYYPGSFININNDITFVPYTVREGIPLVTINYHANHTDTGGSEIRTMPALENSDVPLPDESIFSTPRTGYHIIGWSLVANKDKDIADYDIPGDYSVTTGTVDLYAIWASEVYTIKYITDGNGMVDPTSESHPLSYTGKNTGSTAKANFDYQFVNWTDEGGDEVSTDLHFVPSVHADATFIANFELNTYTVTYKPGEHGAWKEESTGDLHYDDATPELPKGYENSDDVNWAFDGWNVEPADTVTSNATYTAQWKNIGTHITIMYFKDTYDKNGLIQGFDTVPTQIGVDFTPTSVQLNAKKPANGYYDGVLLDRDGKEITSWTAVSGTGTNAVAVLYKPIPYTVTYNPGEHGDWKEESNSGLHYDDAMPALPTGYEKSDDVNWAFDGWNATPAEKVTGNATYTAQWKLRNDLTVTFTAGTNGTLSGTALYENIVYGTEFADAVTIVPTPDPNEGYRFASWSPKIPADDFLITINQSYTATFEIDETQKHTANYTIKFYKDGEEVPDDELSDSKTVWINADVTLDVAYTENLTKYEGYKLDAADSDAVPATVKTAGNVYNIYYVKDETKTHTANYIIKFYKDGEEVPTDALSRSNTVWINADVTLNVSYLTNPTKYVGYKLDAAASDTVPATVKTTGNVYNIYYNLNAYTVTFVDWNGNVLGGPQTVLYGGSAVAPGAPARLGYNFIGWDVAFNYIIGNLTVTAVYAPIVAPTLVVIPPVGGPPVIVPVVVPPAVVAPDPAPAPPAVITPTPTPLAPSNNEADIKDVAPPLAVTKYWALLNLLLTIFTALLMIILLITYFTKRDDEDDNGKYEVKKKGVVRLQSLAVTIVAVVVFILTEDITLPMEWIDKYTLWMGVIALVQIIVMVLSKKKYEDKQQQPRPNVK